MKQKLNGKFIIQDFAVTIKDGIITGLEKLKGMTEAAAADFKAEAQAVAGALTGADLKFRNKWVFEAYAPDGSLKWQDEVYNLVTNAGTANVLTEYFKGSAYTAAFYIGLTDGTPTVAVGDTMSSHAGWAEVTAYDEATRRTLDLGSVTTADPSTVDNSASKGVFTISTNSTTIGGAFLVTGTGASTKGATTGTLYAVAAFSAGDKTLDDNDVLNVTVTLTADSA